MGTWLRPTYTSLSHFLLRSTIYKRTIYFTRSNTYYTTDSTIYTGGLY